MPVAMSRTVLGGVAFALVLGLGTRSTRADLVQYSLGGVIDFGDPLSIPFDNITSGTNFSVTYTFETFTPDSNASPAFGAYAGAIQSFDVNIGGNHFTGTGGDIAIRDEFFVGEEAHLATFGDALFTVNSDLYYNLGTLTSDALLTTLNPSDILFGEFLMFETGEGDLSIVGTYTSFTSVSQAIPAPGAALLAMLGFGTIGLLRRRF